MQYRHLPCNVFATISYCRVDRATALKYPPQGEPRISWSGAHITTSASRVVLRKQLAPMGKKTSMVGTAKARGSASKL